MTIGARLTSLVERPLTRDAGIGIVLLAVAILIPFLDPPRYTIDQFVLFFIWAGVVTQWNLVFGVAGIFSLAQMAVFAMGGYGAALIALYVHWSIWVTGILGALMAVGFSALIGAATIRLRGAYVALLTLGVAVVMKSLIESDSDCFYYEGATCYNFTGGPRGLSKFGDFGFREWLGYKQALLGNYYLGLLLLVIGSLFAFAVIRGPLGHAFRALRDNDALARTRGINRVKYQVLVFALSGFFTGLMGAFYAGHYKTFGTTVLDFSTMLTLLAMMVVGGLGRPWGPIVGCALMMIVDDRLKTYAEWRTVGMGAITVLFIIIFRQGVVGVIETAWRRLTRPRATTASTPESPRGN